MVKRSDYQSALKLRSEGKTYGEIRSILKIPKSTLSSWLKKLELSPTAKKRIGSKQGKGLLALSICNQKRTERIKLENEAIRSENKRLVGNLNQRDLLLVGAALYWGEGYKNFSKDQRISFTNSDPDMILIFLEFLKRTLAIDIRRIKAEVRFYPGLDPVHASEFWQTLTNIPKENLHTYKCESKASQGRRPKDLLPNGTLQLRVNSRKEFFKIRGLIDGIIKATDQKN